MKNVKKLVSMVLVMVMIFTLFGCGGFSNAGSNEENVLTFAIADDIATLDPVHNYELSTLLVGNQMVETLLKYDVDGQLQPYLASSWEAKDELTYVYQIRNDVTFWDGTQMTADDVVFSLNRILDPANDADTAWLYDSVDSITKTGEWEVTVKLSKADPSWQYVVACCAGGVYSKAYFEEKGSDFGTAEGGLMATGPYKYESWTLGSQIVLKKNDSYWDKTTDLVVDKIIYNIVGDESSMAIAVTSGQADVMVSFSTAVVDQIESASAVELYTADGLYINFLAMNNMRAPFSDENVRKAVSYAVDCNSIKDVCFGNYADYSTGLPFGSAAYSLDKSTFKNLESKINNYAYNLNLAKEYMAKSAYPNGFSCKLIYRTTNFETTIATILQAELKEIGINLELQGMSTSDYNGYARGRILDNNGVRDYDLLLGSWIPDYLDTEGWITPLFSSSNIGAGGANRACYKSDTVDSLLSKQAASTDNKERAQYLAEACVQISNDCPYVNLFYRKAMMALNSKYTTDFSSIYIYNLYVKDFKLK